MMANSNRNERERTSAAIATVQSMLNDVSEEDFATKLSLEEHQRELEEELAGIPDWEAAHASAQLVFGGRPVVGGQGIETEFAGKMLESFQDLVAKHFALKTTGLGQRGVVPDKSYSKLHVTNIARGSFGFVVEQLNPQSELIDTPLKNAMDSAYDLLSAFGEQKESGLETLLESVDPRVLGSVRAFFSTLQANEATLKLSVDGQEHAFDLDSIARASERVDVTELRDEEETIVGEFAGALPEGHFFELRTHAKRQVIRGKVSPEIATSQLDEWVKDLAGKRVSAQVQVRKVLRRGELTREAFTLLTLMPDG